MLDLRSRISDYKPLEQDWLRKHYQVVLETTLKVQKLDVKTHDPPKENIALSCHFFARGNLKAPYWMHGHDKHNNIDVDYCHWNILRPSANTFGVES